MSLGTILHVTESFGGGVATAIQAYAKATPEFDHHLLRTTREGDVAAVDQAKLGERFVSVTEMPRHPLGARRSIRAARKAIRPNVIHAHSSFAGAFVRTSVRNRKEAPIIYTPHGFSFERLDIPVFMRKAFRLFEALFSLNTDTIAGCSERETEFASRWNAYRPAVLVPNQSDGAIHLADSVEQSLPVRSERVLAGGGRLTPAKGADLFADIVLKLRDYDSDFTPLWIGGGDPSDEQSLTGNGVHVTGWLPRAHSLSALKQSDVYLHTSRWEGFPFAVLEAHNLGLPIVVRDIPAFSGVGNTVKGHDAHSLAKLLHEVLNDAQRREENIATWRDYLRDNNEVVQAGVLRQIYTRAAEQ